MLAYAGVSLHYLFRINFAPTVFAVFGKMKYLEALYTFVLVMCFFA